VKPSIRMPLLVAVISLPLVALGARLREHAPNHEQWFNANFSDIEPAHGATYAFADWWPLITVMWLFGIILFIVSLTTASWILNRIRSPLIKATTIVVFVLLYTWAVIVILQGAFSDLLWRFYVLSFGECLTAISLIVGICQIMLAAKQRPAPFPNNDRDPSTS
jgi:hypothetical protein